MTKREYKYHLLRKLFKPVTISFIGTQGISQLAPFLTVAAIEKAVKELIKGKISRAAHPVTANYKILKPVPWDEYEAVIEREQHKALWERCFQMRIYQ